MFYDTKLRRDAIVFLVCVVALSVGASAGVVYWQTEKFMTKQERVEQRLVEIRDEIARTKLPADQMAALLNRVERIMERVHGLPRPD